MKLPSSLATLALTAIASLPAQSFSGPGSSWVTVDSALFAGPVQMPWPPSGPGITRWVEIPTDCDRPLIGRITLADTGLAPDNRRNLRIEVDAQKPENASPCEDIAFGWLPAIEAVVPLSPGTTDLELAHPQVPHVRYDVKVSHTW